MLTRASEVFAELTLGSFSGLTVGYEDDQPVILGERAGGGGKVDVAGMSDGTRDQLYLALRLASLERYLSHNEPFPFIVDDVLVNFDDARSRATLKVLAGLSERTQVIVFTHHERVVALAKEAGGERAFVQRLGREETVKNAS